MRLLLSKPARVFRWFVWQLRVPVPTPPPANDSLIKVFLFLLGCWEQLFPLVVLSCCRMFPRFLGDPPNSPYGRACRFWKQHYFSKVGLSTGRLPPTLGRSRTQGSVFSPTIFPCLGRTVGLCCFPFVFSRPQFSFHHLSPHGHFFVLFLFFLFGPSKGFLSFPWHFFFQALLVASLFRIGQKSRFFWRVF